MSSLTDKYHLLAKDVTVSAFMEHFQGVIEREALDKMSEVIDASLDIYRRAMDTILEEELKK